MDSTVSHDELSSKLKLAVLGVISGALAGKKRRLSGAPTLSSRSRITAAHDDAVAHSVPVHGSCEHSIQS